MTNRRPVLVVTLAIIAWAVFAAFVLSNYGWHLLLIAVVPLIGGILWLAVFALASWGAGRLVAGRLLLSDRPTFEDVYLQLLAGTAILADAKRW